MKEFDLEKAKAGHPICTRDGSKARILCYDFNVFGRPILAAVTLSGFEWEKVFTYHENGRYSSDDKPTAKDLVLYTKENVGYVNIFSSKCKRWCSCIYKTEAEAKNAKLKSKGTYITTIKIEWSE